MSTILAEPVFGSPLARRGRGLHVYMMDLLSNVTYYTGHLSAALGRLDDLQVTLGSITYSYDPSFFRRHDLRNEPGVLDVTYRLPRVPAGLRRGAKLVEMENRIKEQQLALFADRTSTELMRSNQLRLYFSTFAYQLMQGLRRLGLKGTEMAQAQCQTIRLKLSRSARRSG